jgi:hypothetical protein
MRALKAFGAFWYDFVVGDDWRIFAGVVAALGVTAALAHAGVPAWWFLPVAAVTLPGWSLARAVRHAGRE